jgi:hypothetical protein
MLMMILPARASPYLLSTGTALSNSTARMTMTPAGVVPQVPAVVPLPSTLARATSLTASRSGCDPSYWLIGIRPTAARRLVLGPKDVSQGGLCPRRIPWRLLAGRRKEQPHGRP